MSTSESAFPKPLRGRALRLPALLAGRAIDAVCASIAVWRNRRIVGELRGLDEHLLRDIGLSRGDVESALSEPFYRDSSWRLAERALEARQCDRARAKDAQRWAALLQSAETAQAKTPPCPGGGNARAA
jgi:uncharacterized protein YjiS (DUF1127 family)